jgi:S-adenosylmethionine-dependent methyltransferase
VSSLDPNDVAEAVRRIYTASEREWQRMDRHRTEFAVTRRALAQYLPSPPAKILDCGGGPGRYAIDLAQEGYEVTLFDLSPDNLALARQKAAEAGVTLAGIEQGYAQELTRFPDAGFDAVLLMGPLYHLLSEKERKAAIAEAYRVVRPGGLVFAAFISRFAAHRDAAAKYPTEPVEMPGLYEKIEQSGLLPPREGVTFVAYFAHPDEVEPLVRGQGFEIVETLGAEGFVSVVENYAVNALEGQAWDWWVEANWRAAHEPSLRGAVEHLLIVARRPRWKAVLKEIVRTLDAAGLWYCVISGTATALHGVPVPVKDIDVILDREGVYRAGELFAAKVVEPVAYRVGEQWRSHFGRFDFDGIMVEMMAELERREAMSWAPSGSGTEELLDLEGVQVRAAWLEEETLAYIRRGRLDRAALMLPRCDHARLLALLRGEVKTPVL